MRIRFSMRWWLALAFAAIAATTAVVVAEIFTERAESAFRSRAEEIAVGSAVAAAREINRLPAAAPLRDSVAEISSRRKLALFVVDADGGLLSDRRAHGIGVVSVEQFGPAVQTALDDHRYVDTADGGRVIVVGLRVQRSPAAAVVVVALRPDLVAEIGILRDEVVPSTLLAIVAGAAVGLVIAVLIGSRLRQIARAANRIADGEFDDVLRSRFPDELGQLAASVDGMRIRLRDSFGQLAAERDRLRLLLAQLEEGVVAVDSGLLVAFANDVAAVTLGPEQVRVGQPLPEPWPDVSLRELAVQLFEPGAAVVYARAKPDHDHTFAIAGIPSAGGSGFATVLIRDITESERRERAEREFVANAAHELRTPIQAIGNAVEVLRSGAVDDPADRERFLSIVERQTGRLRRLVRALLMLARAQTREEAIRLQPVELRPVLEQVAAELTVAEGVEIVVSCPDGVAVLGNREFVEQIVSNLAENAAKQVTVGSVELRARAAPGGLVAIEVADTGPGIALADQARIFDRFYSGDRGAREGFGLGLALVREVARALGGVVELDSAPGQGTTARVILASTLAPVA